MSSSRVRSVERGLDILIHVASAEAPASVADIATALSLPKSTAYHLVNVLAQRGFLEYQETTKAWTIGATAFAVGTRYAEQGALEKRARPLLARLTGDTRMTSHLAVLQGMEVTYLAKREAAGPGVRLVTDVGTRLPAHRTSVGRAILAFLDPADLQARFEGMDWDDDDGDVVSYDGLLDVLAQVRRRGYAVERGNTTPGITCVAAPLRFGPSVVASIGVAFVDAGSTDAQISQVGEAVKAVAREGDALRPLA